MTGTDARTYLAARGLCRTKVEARASGASLVLRAGRDVSAAMRTWLAANARDAA